MAANRIDLELRLAEIVLATIDAINTRNFDPAAPVWQYLTPGYQVQLDYDERLESRDAVFARLQGVCEEFPEYQIRTQAVNTILRARNRRATVFVNVKVEGMPAGVTRESILCYDLEQSEPGEWAMVKMLGQEGLNLGA